MSDSNRPTFRWSSSTSMTTKSAGYSINQTMPVGAKRGKLFRPLKTNQQTFSQRMAKTKHDVEELFKFYYSNDIKFDTFERQVVTGTGIPSARTSTIIQDNSTNSSVDVFSYKHCVSREQMSTLNMNCNEYPTNNNEIKEPTIKRTVQVRIDNNPTMVPPSLSLSPSSLSPGSATSMAPNFILPKIISSARQDELNESTLVRSVTVLDDISIDSLDNSTTKRSKPINVQRSLSSLPNLPPVPPPSILQMNNRNDTTNLSHTSFSTTNLFQPHMVTGTAVTVCQRSSSKPTWCRNRTKSNMGANSSLQQQPHIKISSPSIFYPVLIQPDVPESPVLIGTQRVVSIPSKCSHYVVVSIPQMPARYNAPTYVERLLLPERFPTLFQNIVHSYEQNRNN